MNKSIKNSLLVLLGIAVLNYIAQRSYLRFDLTEDKRYTLSEVSEDLLDSLDESLYIDVYLQGEFPAEFKRLQIETAQFLDELQARNGSVNIRFINPDDYREDLIKRGMLPSRLTVEEDGKLSEAIIFPWAELTYGTRRTSVSLLPSTQAKSQEEQLQQAIEKLEYSFANGIATLLKDQKPSIAVLAGNGELDDKYLYSLLSDIRTKYRLAKFTLDSTASNPEKTLKDLRKYDLAFIAKPTERFSEREKLVLDQFITHGGKSLWMLDANYSDTDSLYNEGKMMAFPRDLNLTDLLFGYQVRINNKLIKDLYSAKIPLATGNVGNQSQFQQLPWFYYPLAQANPYHVITKNVSPVRFRFTTQIDTLKGGLQKTPLLVSSPLSKKIGTPKIIELQSITQEPQQRDYSDGPQLLAVLLEGDFASAYENRIKPFKTQDYLAKGGPNKMIVIADGDLAKNEMLKGKPMDLAKDKWTGDYYGNKEFLSNAIDYLMDDAGLLPLKNKTIKVRLLDKKAAYESADTWKLFNIGMPLLLLGLFGFGFNYLRKRKYSN
ncbi:Gliding motility-associated ABC transporter substrate-binding protein GldG [Tenacibaculum litopenaei]|uniref:gliding motility-associated ABC transporter substrate-binding protein GldG n=1 Tax=Tenacibaculum litopenaei TaxID=396016 RepID=UPI003894589C